MLNTLHTEDTQKREYKISLISIVVLKSQIYRGYLFNVGVR